MADEAGVGLDARLEVLVALLSICFDEELVTWTGCELLPSGLFVVGGGASPPVAPPQAAKKRESTIGNSSERKAWFVTLYIFLGIRKALVKLALVRKSEIIL